ncbi:MAG: hypothetical protein ACTHMY_16975 [Solirubrobacteraceae bacterium]
MGRIVGRLRAKWKAWRWRGLYSRRHLATGLIAVAVTLVALSKARDLLDVQDPPLSTHVPADVFLQVTPPPSLRRVLPLTQFVAFMDIQTNGCENPVHVVVSVGLIGRQSVAPAKYVNVRGALLGEFLDPTQSATNFGEAELSHTAWQATFSGQTPSTYIGRPTAPDLHPRFGGPGFATPAIIAPTWHNDSKFFASPVDTWFAQTETLPGRFAFPLDAIRLKFDANWAFPRSYRTCYVLLPNLGTANATLPSGALRPGHGRISVSPTHGAVVDATAGIPPPTDPQGSSWTCQISLPTTPACGGFAVVELHNANRDDQFYLLICGAVIALALATAAESLLKFNWPLPKKESLDGPESPGAA